MNCFCNGLFRNDVVGNVYIFWYYFDILTKKAKNGNLKLQTLQNSQNKYFVSKNS
mgnify:CR=1 FL=1